MENEIREVILFVLGMGFGIGCNWVIYFLIKSTEKTDSGGKGK